MSACLGLGEDQGIGMLRLRGQQSFFCGNENVLKLPVVMGARFYEYTKSHWIRYLKWINCMTWKLYCNKAVKMKKQKQQQKTNYRATDTLGSIPANWFIARSCNFPYSSNSHLKYNTWKWKLLICFLSNMFLYKMFEWLPESSERCPSASTPPYSSRAALSISSCKFLTAVH